MSADMLQGIANMLGIGATNLASARPMSIVGRIEEGLPLASLDHVAVVMFPKDPGFKHRIVPRSTWARLKKAQKPRLSADISDRLTRIARVWTLAHDVWGSEEGARAFLERPHPLLESRSPLDVVIATEIGAQLVEDILGRLRYGSAA